MPPTIKTFFQPIFALKDSRPIFFEPLARYHQGPFDDTQQLIDFAEESGLIVELGDQVFEQLFVFSWQRSVQDSRELVSSPA